jgi:drug/metabolite transporter (DMT)-like permease
LLKISSRGFFSPSQQGVTLHPPRRLLSSSSFYTPLQLAPSALAPHFHSRLLPAPLHPVLTNICPHLYFHEFCLFFGTIHFNRYINSLLNMPAFPVYLEFATLVLPIFPCPRYLVSHPSLSQLLRVWTLSVK